VVQQRFLYVFGGNTLQDSFNDTWRIDLHECLAHGVADWERVDTTGEVKHIHSYIFMHVHLPLAA
jgi:hypothetical protein